MAMSLTSWFSKVQGMDSLAPSSLFERLERLTPRERRIVLTTIGLLAFFILFSIGKAGVNKITRLQRQVETTSQGLTKVQGLSQEALQKSNQGSELRGRIHPAPGFYLASFIESQAARFRVNIDNLGTAATQDLGEGVEEVSLDVKIPAISFAKALNLLSELENTSTAYVRLSRVRMKSLPNDAVNVELSFKVSAYVKKA